MKYRVQTKTIRAFSALLLLAGLLSNCGDGTENFSGSVYSSPQSATGVYGNATARLVWPESPAQTFSQALARLLLSPPILPASVLTVRISVSAADIPTPLVQSFAASAGYGLITGIPVGSDRTFLVEGVNAAGMIDYTGTRTGIVIVPDATTDVGIVQMVSTAPVADLAITVPAANPHDGNAVPLAISGSCATDAPHTVTLSGSASASTDCISGVFAFTLSDPGTDGAYAYAISQTRTGSGITSAAVSFTWNLDRVPPATPVLATPTPIQAPGNSQTISGACESGAQVVLTGADSQTKTCTGGQFQITVTESVDGAYDYAIAVMDAAGNASAAVNVSWLRVSPALVISPTAVGVSESGTFGAITVALSLPPDGNVVVDLTSPNTSEVTVAPAQLTFSTANWSVPQAVTLTGVNDFVADGDQIVSVQFLVNAGQTADLTGYKALAALAPATVTVTNSDNDTAGATLSKTVAATSEAGGADSFTIALTSQPDANVTISAASGDSGEVVVSAGGTLTFTAANWSTPQTVSIAGVNDDVADGSRPATISFTVSSIGDPSYNGIAVPDVTVTNADDGDAAGVTLSKTSATTTEPGGADTFTIVLNSEPTANVTIGTTAGGDGSEVLITGGSSLTFTASTWNMPQAVYLAGVDDSLADGDQAVALGLTAASSDTTYNGIGIAGVSVTNIDDDTAGVALSKTSALTSEAAGTDAFTVVLNTAPTAIVTVSTISTNTNEVTVTSGGTLTFTSANWNIPQTVNIAGVDDAIADGNQTVTLTTSVSSADTLYNGGDVGVTDITVVNSDDDSAGVTVSKATAGTTEAGGTDSFTVNLNTAPTANVTITTTSGDTSEVAVTGGGTLTFTSVNWSAPQTVSIAGVGDDVADGDVAVTLATAAGSSDASYNNIAVPDVVATNSDDDSAGVTLNKTTAITSEAGGTDSFTVVLTSEPTAAVTITTSSGNAAEVAITGGGMLMFTSANWSTPQTVSLAGVDDSTNDGNTNTNLSTAAASADTTYNSIVVADVTVTNVDDDPPGVTLSTTTASTTESGATETFTVVLDSQPVANVTINVTSDNTAEVAVTLGGTLAFTNANWSTPQSVTVGGVDDNVDDGDKTVNVTTTALSVGDPDYNGISVVDVTVTNTDNDTVGVNVSKTTASTTEAGGTDAFTFVLTSEPTATVTITTSSGNTGEVSITSGGALTFTTANWSTPQTVNLAGVNDDLDDGDVAVTLTTSAGSADAKYNNIAVADVTATNTDNDAAGVTVSKTTANTSEAGATDSFTLVLTSEPTADVTITTTSGDTGEVSITSGGTLTFTNLNWNAPQQVNIAGVNDNLDDGNVAVTLTTAAGSADAKYNNIAVADVTATNADDSDTAGVTVSKTTASTTEGGGTDSFTIVLTSEPTADVTITTTSGDTGEVSITGGGALTFTNLNWNTPQQVNIAGVNDALDDGNVAVLLTTSASSADATYNGIAVGDVTATNADDGDTAGITVFPTAGLTTNESGTTDNFTVVLWSEPSGNVIVNVVSLDTTEVSVDQATLTFNAGNWSAPQTVIVTGLSDGIGDGNQSVTIALTMNGGTTDTTGYAAMNPADVSVTNLDSSAAGVTVTPTSGLTTTEAGGWAGFTVVLNTAPDGNVVINVVSSDTTECTVDSATLTFDNTNWFTPQTVTVTGVDDALADGSQNVTIALTMDTVGTTDTTGYDPVNPPDVSVTNADDDTVSVAVTPTSGLTTSETGATATFDVWLNSIPNGDVVINVSPNDATEVSVDKATLTFTTSDWSLPQTVTVSGLNDDLDDGNQTVTIALTINVGGTADTTGYAALNPPDVSVTNSDDDLAGFTVTPISGLNTTETGGTANFTVRLNTQPNNPVIINVVSSDTTEATVDKATLTFAATDWSTPQTVTITGVSDAIVDGNQAVTIVLTINGGTTDTTGYAGLNPPDVSLINSDNDVVGATVNPTSGLVTTEAGGAASFTVRLNTIPNNTVVIVVVSSDTGEATVDKGTLTFGPSDWATPQTVTVTGVDDASQDGNQAVTILLVIDTVLTLDGTGYDGVNPTDVSVTNNDDDTVAVTVNPVSGLSTTEAGGTDTFTVVLNSEPDGDVAIDVVSGDTGEVTVDKALLTFTQADWSTAQTVTVTGVDDLIGDTSQTVTIALSINVGGTNDLTGYAGLTPAQVPDVDVVNIGTNVVGVTVTPTSGLATTEGGATGSFTVVLNSAPDNTVVIDVVSGDTAEVSVDKATLTFTTGDWSAPQTVALGGVNDTTADGDQVVTIALSINTGLTLDSTGYDSLLPGAVDDVTVTNADNESAPEGSPAAPLDVSGSVPAEGSVGAGSSYYIITGLTQGVQYMVSLSSVSEDVLLYVYPDTSNYAAINELCSSDNFADARPEACLATATATQAFVVRVDIASGVTAGGTFSINVTPAPASTGASGAPIDITAALPGYLGGLNGSNSYYVVTGLTPNTTYRVQLGNLTANVDLRVYSNVGFSNQLCVGNVSSIAETCEATTPAGVTALYIRVQNAAGSTDAAFYVDVMNPLVDEGTTGSPINLTGLLPWEGMIKTTASYYVVTGLVPNATYTVELINMIGQGELQTYSDAFATINCTSDLAGNWPESCTVNATSSGNMYFRARPGTSFSSAGATYRVQVK